MFKDITEDKPLVVKCQSDWVIHANDKDFDLKRAQETLKNCSQRDKRDDFQRTSCCCCEKTFKVTSPTPIHKRRRTRIKTTLRQSNKSRKRQEQRKIDLLLGGLTDTLGKSFDLKRTQEALKNTREAKLCLETESSCDSH